MYGDIFLYADDTTITYANNDVNVNVFHANADMRVLSIFFSINGLTINSSKTYFVNFKSHQKRIQNRCKIVINGTEIEQKQSIKFLGVNIDQHLNWKVHIDQLKMVLSRTAGVLNRLRKILPEKVKSNIYFSFVHSRILYGIETWGTAAVSNLKKLQRVQNSIVKAVYDKPRLFSTFDLFNNSGPILPVQAVAKKSLLIIVFKMKNEMIISNILIQQMETVYGNRRPFLLKLPNVVRTGYGLKRFSYGAVNVWNVFVQDHHHLNQLGILSNFNSFKEIVNLYVKNNLSSFL